MMSNVDPYFQIPPKPMESGEKVKQTSTKSGEQQLKNSKQRAKHKSGSSVKFGESSRRETEQEDTTDCQCCAITMIIVLVILGLAMTALMGAVALSDCFGIERCPIISLI
uniref:Uncharacterized protein n=1 Tax=Parascaris univalens TaxID=6257 RepID=A0A915C337_PARUN